MSKASSSYSPNNNNLLNCKLAHLPLRPSSLSLLKRHGFVTTSDVYDSSSSSSSSNGLLSSGGISNLACELEISSKDALSLLREVRNAHSYVSNGDDNKPSQSSSDSSNHNNYHPQDTTTTTTTIGETTNTATSLTAAQILKSRLHPQTIPTNETSNNTYGKHQHQQNHHQYYHHYRPIVSFVQSIDTLLGGGFHPGELTEVCGPPGCGKTQLCIQLCVDANLPKEFGGVHGRAAYIDTEGSFTPERCMDMAKAMVQHVHATAKRRSSTVPTWFTTSYILNGIDVFRVFDETSQTATIHSLPNYFKQLQQRGERPVKMLIIDSIAFHYRSSDSDYKVRTKSLTIMAEFLNNLASTFNLSIVVVNQMTTRIISNESTTTTADNHNIKHIPALGESWAHATTTRLLISPAYKHDNDNNNDNQSYNEGHGKKLICRLVKSTHKPAGIAHFSITQNGIRDCIQNLDTTTVYNSSSQGASKRTKIIS